MTNSPSKEARTLHTVQDIDSLDHKPTSGWWELGRDGDDGGVHVGKTQIHCRAYDIIEYYEPKARAWHRDVDIG